jgi:hypothetical protein
MTKEWKSVRLYLVPSVIYLIHNNVTFATLTYVDPAIYHVLCTPYKILYTEIRDKDTHPILLKSRFPQRKVGELSYLFFLSMQFHLVWDSLI